MRVHCAGTPAKGGVGGAFFARSAGVFMQRVLFKDNSAHADGGAASIDSSGGLELRECVFDANKVRSTPACGSCSSRIRLTTPQQLWQIHAVHLPHFLVVVLAGAQRRRWWNVCHVCTILHSCFCTRMHVQVCLCGFCLLPRYCPLVSCNALSSFRPLSLNVQTPNLPGLGGRYLHFVL